jgi:hypothetical protein
MSKKEERVIQSSFFIAIEGLERSVSGFRQTRLLRKEADEPLGTDLPAQ